MEVIGIIPGLPPRRLMGAMGVFVACWSAALPSLACTQEAYYVPRFAETPVATKEAACQRVMEVWFEAENRGFTDPSYEIQGVTCSVFMTPPIGPRGSYGSVFIYTTQQGCYEIKLTGPSRTKARPAGPALPHVALVTENGAPSAGRAVQIQVGSGGSLSGVTDAGGGFPFTYIPPPSRVKDRLVGTCNSCRNVAQKEITVDGADICPREQ